MTGFRLARLRRVRVLQEDAAKAVWALARRDANAADERARHLAEAADLASRHVAQQLASNALAPREVLGAHSAIDGMRRRASEARDVAKQLEEAAEAARQPYDERRREARALGLLEGNWESERRRARDRREERARDETTSSRSIRERRKTSEADEARS